MSALIKVKMEENLSGDDNKSSFSCKKEVTNNCMAFKIDEDRKACVKADPDSKPHPQKHRRVVFDCVLLPTLASVRKRQAPVVDNSKRLLPVIRPSVEDSAINISLMQDRLKPIGLEIQNQYFTIHQAAREATVTRRFISHRYGGSCRAAFPVPSRAKLAAHGMDDFMFMVPTDMQPEAPLLPGAPGLRLCFAPGADLAQVKRVFVKVTPAHGPKTGRYRYVGMYEVKAAVPSYLKREEYAAQSPRVRQAWAVSIAKNESGLNVRARILLRKELRREPTRRETEDTANFRRGKCQEITTEEIKAAYFAGSERMGVWTMKCVGYDNNFQEELKEKFRVWRPPFRGTKRKRLPVMTLRG